jgi:hypothetical protein
LSNTFDHHNLRRLVRWNWAHLLAGHGYDAFPELGIFAERIENSLMLQSMLPGGVEEAEDASE